MASDIILERDLTFACVKSQIWKLLPHIKTNR
jgi:hypothetical protein